MRNNTEPSRTLALLDQLEQAGFDDTSFSVIHHHKEPQTISEHRRYCSMLVEDGGLFRTINNQLVQMRLELILTMYRSAGFCTGNPGVFLNLAKAALAEIPHDHRPISEQMADHVGRSGGAA